VGADAVRIGGQTRYETAAMVANAAYDMFGFDETQINLARGDVFADALAGGPHAGVETAPIVLTASNELSPATEAFLQEHSDTLTTGDVFGGPDAVSQAVVDAAEAAAQGA
jgi:putative cell wall-binding protein